jgi:hypothetical protein
MSYHYEQPIPCAMLATTASELSADEVESLWRIFVAIDQTWELEGVANVLRSQWHELLAARVASTPSYLGELKNAAAVVEELIAEHPEGWREILFFETIITSDEHALTPLLHAKFYVVNDFVRAQIALGGFASFGGRNYTGYMGGSRYHENPPVRTGNLK